MRKITFIYVLIFLAGCSRGIEGELILSGTIEAETAHAGSRVGGRVESVFVEAGDSISEGDLLFTLEASVLEAERGRIEALVREAEAGYNVIASGARESDIARAANEAEALRLAWELATEGPLDEDISALQAQADALEAVYVNARDNAGRMSELYDEGVISEREHISSTQAAEVARLQWESAVEQVNAVRNRPREQEINAARSRYLAALNAVTTLRVGATPEELEAGLARIATANESLQRIDLDIAECTVTAPQSGIIETFDLKPGDFVAPGMQAVEIISLDTLKVVVYVPENRLGYVRPGMSVDFRVDSFPGEIFQGVVSNVASEAEFTPRNIQTVEERVLQVFAVEVDIQNPGGKLRPGMAADIIVKIGD